MFAAVFFKKLFLIQLLFIALICCSFKFVFYFTVLSVHQRTQCLFLSSLLKKKFNFLLLQKRLKFHSEYFNSLHLPLPAEALFICFTGLYDTDRFTLGRIQITGQKCWISAL